MNAHPGGGLHHANDRCAMGTRSHRGWASNVLETDTARCETGAAGAGAAQVMRAGHGGVEVVGEGEAESVAPIATQGPCPHEDCAGHADSLASSDMSR